MSWYANSAEETPFTVTHVAPLSSAPQTIGTSDGSGVSSPAYRRYTAIQELSESSASHGPLSDVDVITHELGNALSAATFNASGPAVAPEVPEEFCRVLYTRHSPPTEVSPSAEDTKRCTAPLLRPTGVEQVSRSSFLSPAAAARHDRTAPSFGTTSRSESGVFNLHAFTPFHRVSRSAANTTSASLDNSLRSSIDHGVPGHGTWSRPDRKSLVTGTLPDKDVLTTHTTPAPPPLAPAPRGSVAATTSPAARGARRLTATDKGPLAPHRLLSEGVFARVCAFLEEAGKEIEDVALQRAIANGESCLFTGGSGNVDGTPGATSLTASRQRLSASATASSFSAERVRQAQDEQEDDVLRIVEATHFPFRDRYNDYRFPETWFAEDAPECAATDGSDHGVGADGDTDDRVPAVHAIVALTEDPPFFVHGMLFDPLTNRPLFRGRAFREEARVMATLLYPQGRTAGRPPRDNSTGTEVPRPSPPVTQVPSTTGVSAEPAFSFSSPLDPSEGRAVKVLQRDFTSVARADGCGFMVQSLSLLPMSTPVEANKQQLLPSEVVRRILPLVGAATLTRAFPLRHVVRDSSPGEEQSRLSTMAQRTENTHRCTAPEAVQPALRGEVVRGRGSVETRRHMAPTATATVGGGTLEWMGAVDAIKKYLEHYRIHRFRAHVRHYHGAVRRVQRFMRMCLAKRQRALQRMLRLWRRLEVESRLKLSHYEAPPSSLERVDMVANTILQQHMLTSRESKMQLVADLWQRRRQAYWQWLRRDGRVEVAAEPHHTRSAAGHDTSSETRVVAPGDDVTHRKPPGTGSGGVWRRLSRTAVLAEGENEADLTEAQRRTRSDRDKAFRHTQFGWYIAPEALLLESHRRLLEGLKQSVLSMEQVRYELERAADALSMPPT